MTKAFYATLGRKLVKNQQDQQKLNAFIIKNKHLINAWAKSHPESDKLPVVRDRYGNYHWVSRQLRRKARMQK